MKLINYLKETKSELKEVVWPTRSQTIAFTIAVILISIAVAIFLGGVDFGLKQLLTFILK